MQDEGIKRDPPHAFMPRPETVCSAARKPFRPATRFAALLASRVCRIHVEFLALLFLHGSPGTGKSHLVRGLLKRIIRRKPDRTARVISARDLARLLTEIPRRTRAGLRVP